SVTARPRQTVSTQLEDKIALLGYDTAQSGKEFAITLYWRALQSLDRDYTAFVHVLSPMDGHLVDQRDRQPLDGQYPTGIWSPGEVVSDTYRFTLPAGEYRLAAGMYDLATMTRLRTPTDDKILLDTIRVEP
ncbi:MAG: hypothetical protein Q8O07_03650, partial [Chloroflexota bacterium]|nr:hypothetical protein [Chloroflexota bacterium]